MFIAVKRLADYKTRSHAAQPLSMDSPGTYGWIMHQNAKNLERIGRLPPSRSCSPRRGTGHRGIVPRSPWPNE